MGQAVLWVLGGIGCVAMMGAVMVGMRYAPRVLGRSHRLRHFTEGLVARLRAQSNIDRLLSWVEDEHPDLGRATAPDGTVTLLFSDIEDSSGLTERLGDKRWLEVLGAHNALVRAEVGKHGGYEVKAQGDGFMVAFPSARRAVECAVAIQRAIEGYSQGEQNVPIHVRIGLHTGEAIRQEGDFFGKAVICAARIADEARGDEILVSSLVKELTESAGEFEFERPRQAALEGLAGSYQLFPVRWGQEARVLSLGSRAAG